MKIGVIINLKSTRTRKARWWIKKMENKYRSPKVIWRNTHSLDEARRSLVEMRDEGVDLLVLCGGDGTVQKALTVIHNQLSPWKPRILHIPGGGTNVLAKNLGLDSGPVMALRTFFKKYVVENKRLITIPSAILKVEDEELSEPVYGITFTNGLLFELIRKYISMTPGMRSVTRLVYSTIAEFMVSVLRGEDPKAEYFKRIPIDIVIDGKQYPYFEIVASIATVLPNPLMWFNPFYSADGIPVSGFYFLANSMSNREIFRHLFPMLTGRFPGTKAYNGFAREVIMNTIHGYAVDGEPFFIERPRTIKILSGPTMEFVVIKGHRRIKKKGGD